MNNIYDTAYQLVRELKDLDAYKDLKATIKEMESDSEAASLYQEFRDLSQDYQEKLMAGEEVGEEAMQALQTVSEKMGQNLTIQKLMHQEQMISQVMNDINKIISEPLNELYQL